MVAERVAGGAAHAEVAREEHTTRYQVTRAFAELAGWLTGARAAATPTLARRGAAPPSSRVGHRRV
jgi:hypothetical protein